MITSDRERQAPIKVSDAEPTHLARYTFASQFIKETDNVLDVPCGSGYGSNLLAEKAKFVTGVDIHAGAIEHAKEFFQKDNTKFSVADMQRLEEFFHDDVSFDAIVSFEGIEHIDLQTKFLDDISRVLKPGGTLIISTPRKPHGSPYHTVEFSLEEFIDILSTKFVVEKMFGQIYTDIFDMQVRKENPHDYTHFNFIAVCKPR